MKWNVFKKDDPNTWPEIDCPILVYDDVFVEFYICKWNNSLGKFVEPQKKILHHWRECYYAYIGYVPSGYKVFNPIICANKKHGYTCDEYDDGYCMYRDLHPDCEHQKEVNEYGVELKRIWKEFEE